MNVNLIILFILLLSPFIINDYRIKVSKPSDLELMARVVEAESKGEPFKGKYLVASTIVNRTNHPLFPANVRSVVYSPNQYADPSPTYSEQSMKAVKMAIKNPYPRILYFYNPKKAKNKKFTSKLRNCFQLGNHRFCSNFN